MQLLLYTLTLGIAISAAVGLFKWLYWHLGPGSLSPTRHLARGAWHPFRPW
ncbi:MAG: hypothetical protein WAM91_13300 [Candidatus Acidiferrales bacterium]